MNRHCRSTFLSGLLILSWVVVGSAEEPYLVRDIRPGVTPGVVHEPASLTMAGDRLFFTYDDGIHGRELWTSDGESDGTQIVADIRGGPAGSDPWNFTASGGSVYFQALDGEDHEAIWVSDGASDGTRRFAAMPSESDVVILAVLDGRVFFSASEGLWVSDGQLDGTQLLKDRLVEFGRRWVDRSGDAPVVGYTPVVLDGEAFFIADDADTGVELWASDGTTAGTRLVEDLLPGPDGSNPRELTGANEQLFFLSVLTNEQRPDLWVTDGNPGAAQFLTRLADPLGGELQSTGSRVFFFDDDQLDLWVSDGTPGGTRRAFRAKSPIDDFAVAGEFAYFVEEELDDEGQGLWVSDGRQKGAVLVTEGLESVPIGSAVALGEKLLFEVLSDRMFFELWVASPQLASPLSPLPAPPPGGLRTHEFVRSGERVFVHSMANLLWVTDGSVNGSSIILADLPGAPEQITAAGNGEVYFTVSRQLWFSDGTDGGTRLVKELDPSPSVPAGSNPSRMLAGGERVFFSASGEIWASDGAKNGTVQVHAGLPYDRSRQREIVGDRLFYFSRNSRSSGLWVSDGTKENTRRIGDTWIAVLKDRAFFGAAGGLWVSDGTPEHTELLVETPVITRLATAEQRVFFVAGENDAPQELWVTDGTRERTGRLLDGLTRNRSFTAAGDRIFFSTTNREFGVDLRVSDGDPEGTRSLAEGIVVDSPYAVGDRLFFTWTGESLWVSDGTRGGTTSIAPILSSRCEDEDFAHRCRDIVPLAAASDRFFFKANDGKSGEALWTSDGTRAGTRLVQNMLWDAEFLVLGNRVLFVSQDNLWATEGTAGSTRQLGSSSPANLVALGERAVFAASDDVHGRELWVSDGTPAGTRLLEDIRKGPDGSAPSRLRVQREAVFFAATDDVSRAEPWTSDGTADGTRQLADVVAGREGSAPGEFTLAGDRLFFAADDGVHGSELWALPIDLKPRFRRGDSNGDGTANLSDAVFTLLWLFRGGPEPPCLAGANANGDDGIHISDATYLLIHLFLGGPPPGPPFPGCGTGTLDSDDTLGCGTSATGCL